jgi:hypothetical protein
MKKYCLIIILIFTFNCFAQNDQDSSMKLIYTFDAYLINGYELGYILFNEDNSEIRISLGINSSYNISDFEEETKNITNNIESSVERTFDLYNEYHQFNLKSHYLYEIYKSNLGESYLGVGPFIAYRTQSYTSSYGSTTESLNTDNLFLVGLTAIIGIRSYITKSLSIFAEAELNGYGRWSEEKNESQTMEEYSSETILDGNGWGYDFYYMKFGLRISL